MTAATIVLDSQGAVIGWNHAAESLFGSSAKDVLGRSLDGILDDGERGSSLSTTFGALHRALADNLIRPGGRPS